MRRRNEAVVLKCSKRHMTGGFMQRAADAENNDSTTDETPAAAALHI